MDNVFKKKFSCGLCVTVNNKGCLQCFALQLSDMFMIPFCFFSFFLSSLFLLVRKTDILNTLLCCLQVLLLLILHCFQYTCIYTILKQVMIFIGTSLVVDFALSKPFRSANSWFYVYYWYYQAVQKKYSCGLIFGEIKLNKMRYY